MTNHQQQIPYNKTQKIVHFRGEGTVAKQPHIIHEELKSILRQAKQASSEKGGDSLFRKALRKMHEAPDHLFWQPQRQSDFDLKRHGYNTDEAYREAADIAWDYIERKFYGDIRSRGTPEEQAYDPDREGAASPITLWNRRCQGAYTDLIQKEVKGINPNPIDRRTGDPLDMEGLAQLNTKSHYVEKLELLLQELTNDPTGVLQNTFVRQNPPPPITVQEILLKIYDYISCGEKWNWGVIAKDFDLNNQTLHSAKRKKIKPLLQEMSNRLGFEIKFDSQIKKTKKEIN